MLLSLAMCIYFDINKNKKGNVIKASFSFSFLFRTLMGGWRNENTIGTRIWKGSRQGRFCNDLRSLERIFMLILFFWFLLAYILNIFHTDLSPKGGFPLGWVSRSIPEVRRRGKPRNPALLPPLITPLNKPGAQYIAKFPVFIDITVCRFKKVAVSFIFNSYNLKNQQTKNFSDWVSNPCPLRRNNS